VPLAGGRVPAPGELQFRGKGLLVAAIVAQILIVSIFPGDGSATLQDVVHIATYVAVGVFVVANRRIPWVWLTALGGGLNFAAIAANGGVMPASPRALANAGPALHPEGFVNSGAVATRTCSSSATCSGFRARSRSRTCSASATC
jgi:hypothetical protein